MALRYSVDDSRIATDEEKLTLKDDKDGISMLIDNLQNVQGKCILTSTNLAVRRHSKTDAQETDQNVICFESSEKNEGNVKVDIEESGNDLEYGVDDDPPIHMCVLFALQVGVDFIWNIIIGSSCCCCLLEDLGQL